MRRFSSLGQFARFLEVRAAELPSAKRHGLETAARIVQEEAKAVIGHYQEAAGPFAAWQDLAEATQSERERLGFTPNDPLLRTGTLQNSIDHTVDESKALIGSADPRAKWLELGTSGPGRGIPPRSFLGIAAVHKTDEVVNAIGEVIFATISGKRLP